MRRLLFTLTILVLITTFLSCELFLEKPPKPTIHALVVGIDYKNDSSIKDLFGTINDAKELAAALSLRGQELDTQVEITLMLQEGSVMPSNTDLDPLYPTIDNVLAQIDRIGALMDPNDIFIFYYAGHGYGSEDGPTPYQGFLVLADTLEGTSTAFSPSALNVEVQKLPGSKLLMLDSCFSGAHETSYPLTAEDRSDSTLMYAYDPSMFFLLAASRDQLSWETASVDNHGYFTLQVLNNLGWEHTGTSELAIYDPDSGTRDVVVSGRPIPDLPAPVEKNGTILLGDLFANIPSHSVNDEEGRHTQTPETGDSPLDLVLFSTKW